MCLLPSFKTQDNALSTILPCSAQMCTIVLQCCNSLLLLGERHRCKNAVPLYSHDHGPLPIRLCLLVLDKREQCAIELESHNTSLPAAMSLRPEKAFTTPDAEADCVSLLATGLFKNARPVFRRPNNLDGPHFVRVKDNLLATVPPLGTVEFLVTPRVLPPPTSFSVRVDSSLANAGDPPFNLSLHLQASHVSSRFDVLIWVLYP